MKGTVTLIVPCYNEEESLPIFIMPFAMLPKLFLITK